MIEINGIRKFYGSGESRFQVLKNISLKIEDGDFAVLLGPSGSGKSTLLNVLSGLERPDEGEVRIYFSAVLSAAAYDCPEKCPDGGGSGSQSGL